MRGMVLIMAAGLAGLVGWTATWASSTPADALSPANDTIARLERRVAELEARLERLESQSTGVFPALGAVPFLPPGQSPMTHRPIAPSPFAVPGNPPYLLGLPPNPASSRNPIETQEVNGVKFGVYLLGQEAPATSRR
jgi:hypothetical protein